MSIRTWIRDLCSPNPVAPITRLPLQIECLEMSLPGVVSALRTVTVQSRIAGFPS